MIELVQAKGTWCTRFAQEMQKHYQFLRVVQRSLLNLNLESFSGLLTTLWHDVSMFAKKP